MRNQAYNMRKYLKFSSNELKGILITTLFATSFFAFRQFSDFSKLIQVPYNLLLLLPSFFALLFVFVFAQKYIGIIKGYTITYRYYASGIALGFLCFLISFWTIPLFLPGYCEFKTIPNLRMGRFRPRLKNYEMAFIGLAGPITAMLLNLIILIPLRINTSGVTSAFFSELVLFNAALMVFSMIPIPVINLWRISQAPIKNTDLTLEEGTIGFSVLFASRSLWVFFTAFFVFLAFFSFFFHWITFFIALIFALFVLFWYRGNYE